MQALAHPWLVEQGVAPRHPLDNVVLRRLQRFAAMNKLKRAALLVMAQNLSPAELAGLQHLFSAIDADNSGSITAAELRAALEGFGEKIPEDDLQVKPLVPEPYNTNSCALASAHAQNCKSMRKHADCRR